MIKAILFDLDGTLLNRDASVERFARNQYDRLISRPVCKEQYVQRFIELDARGYVWKDQVYTQLVREFSGCGISADSLLQDYMSTFHQSCIPFPGLHDMLKKLKTASYQLGIISNGRGDFQMKTIEALGLTPYMDIILISEREGIKKPDPAIFHKALLRLHAAPHESVYVGDHPLNDVKGARDAGLMSIWKKDPFYEKAEADFCIEELAELPGIVEKLKVDANENQTT